MAQPIFVYKYNEFTALYEWKLIDGDLTFHGNSNTQSRAYKDAAKAYKRHAKLQRKIENEKTRGFDPYF